MNGYKTFLKSPLILVLTEGGTYPQLPTQPKNVVYTLFKLIHQSNTVNLSCLAKKNRNLNRRKKKVQFITENGDFLKFVA